MKTTILILCVLFATAALGQTASVLPNQPVIIEVPDHPLHASQHDMACEQSLLITNAYTYAKGERPLSDFGSDPEPTTPLGDVARAYRRQHLSFKKAEVVLEKNETKK
jgi:hypothetical protein